MNEGFNVAIDALVTMRPTRWTFGKRNPGAVAQWLVGRHANVQRLVDVAIVAALEVYGFDEVMMAIVDRTTPHARERAALRRHYSRMRRMRMWKTYPERLVSHMLGYVQRPTGTRSALLAWQRHREEWIAWVVEKGSARKAA